MKYIHRIWQQIRERYRPPRLQKMHAQHLADLERRLSMYIGSYLVFLEEGTATEADMARQKARGALHTLGAELGNLADMCGTKIGKIMRAYLWSATQILENSSPRVDKARMLQYCNAQQRIKKLLDSLLKF